MRNAFKELSSQRSIEHDELEYITTSLTRYEKVKEDLQLEIERLQKKNLLLQQDLCTKDELIQKLETANRILTNNNANSKEIRE